MDFEDVKEFKKYKKMFKGKNNYGYCEWSKEIKEKLSGMPKEELINRYKRNQMKYEAGRLSYDKENDMPYINNFIVVAVSISSVLFSVYTVWANALKDYEINTADYFPDTVEAISNAITRSNQIFIGLAEVEIRIAVIIFAAILALWIINKQGDKRIIKEIMYYGEMNELLKGELTKRNIMLYLH